MRLYVEGDGWGTIHDDLLFTEAMLVASAAHAEIAKPLGAHLKQWDEVDAEGTQADRVVVRANARVAWINVDLDGRTTRYGQQLLLDCNSDRGHATFKRFFAAPPNELVRLGLENQLAAMAKFPTLAEEIALPKASAASLKTVVALFEPGDQAVEARGAATLATTRVSIKQAAWRDEANNRRRAVKTALDDHANKHGLPASYADDFFPTQKKSPAKKPAEPSEADRVLALPDAVLRLLPDTYLATLPADAQAAVRTRLGR